MRILYENKFYPYFIHLHQNLEEPDFVSRMNSCNVMLRMINEDPTLLSRVLFSDEANFCNNGQVNRHNMHYWAIENLYWMRSVSFQRPWSLNVLCGIVGNYIEPHFSKESLNGVVLDWNKSS